jgi:hypothetical protein
VGVGLRERLNDRDSCPRGGASAGPRHGSFREGDSGGFPCRAGVSPRGIPGVRRARFSRENGIARSRGRTGSRGRGSQAPPAAEASSTDDALTTPRLRAATMPVCRGTACVHSRRGGPTGGPGQHACRAGLSLSVSILAGLFTESFRRAAVPRRGVRPTLRWRKGTLMRCVKDADKGRQF